MLWVSVMALLIQNSSDENAHCVFDMEREVQHIIMSRIRGYEETVYKNGMMT
jgi:hypothetical protein